MNLKKILNNPVTSSIALHENSVFKKYLAEGLDINLKYDNTSLINLAIKFNNLEIV